MYRKYITQSLRDILDEQMGMDPDEQVSLYEELALMRHAASNFVKLYSVAVEANHAESIALAVSGMTEALCNVERICSAAAKIQQKQRDRFSIHDLKNVINQLTRILYEVCGDQHEDIALEFKRRCDDKLKLPTGYQQGTSLKPDETALMLDSEIPYVEETEEEEDE